jgi:LmbE family N-acetylglucosaminyl deacetylase
MNVLAIGAHFDDVEIGCGGAIAKHVQNGDNVTVLVVTDSDYEDQLSESRRTKDIALKEGKAAAKILGYDLVCGNLKTREVEFNPDLVDLIEKVIVDNSIDTIYTHWDQDVHQDHQSVGKASLTAGRKRYRFLMYRSNLYMNSMRFDENFFVDITQFVDLKLQAIAAHRSEVKKFGSDWLDFWKQEAKNNGLRCGREYAEVFQLVKYIV